MLDELKLFYDSIFTDEKMEDGVFSFDRSILLKESKLIYPSNEWLWSSLEKNIANISFSSIIQNFGLYRFPIKNINNLIFDISVKYEHVLNRLNKELTKWISTINTDTLFKKRFIDCRFISFNYPKTLENRYLVETEKICYIHGTIVCGNLML